MLDNFWCNCIRDVLEIQKCSFLKMKNKFDEKSFKSLRLVLEFRNWFEIYFNVKCVLASYALSTSPQASQTQQQQQLHLQRVHASVSPASGCRTQSLQQQYQQQEILRRQQHHQQQHRRRQNGFQNQHCDSYSPVGHHSQQRSGAVENGSSVRFNSHERQHSNRRYPQQFQSESQRPSFSPIRNHSSNVDGVSALNVNQLSTVTMPLVNAAAAAYHTTSPSPLNTKNNRLSHDYASNYSLNKHLQSDPSPPLFTAANDYDGCANGGFYDNANLTVCFFTHK